MRHGILTIAFAIMLRLFAGAQGQQAIQSAPNDTANYPYWVKMMQDPSANFFKTQRAFNVYWKDRKITRGCGWKVFKRWEYMTQSRIYPNGDRIPQDAVVKARNEMAKSKRSPSGTWTNLGPSQIPAPGPGGYEGLGRLNVVAWHPTDGNKIYVGSPSGGFWKSNDDGATWMTTTDSLTTLGVSAIVVDKGNPNNIFIGTGDRDAGDAPGLGVYKSTNGGSSWTPWNTGMGDQTVGKIIQHPTNYQILLAAASGGVYRSINQGSSWTLVQAGSFKDILFKPNDPNTVYAVAGTDFYKSTNNGSSFTHITSGLPGGQRAAIAVTAANPNYVYVLMSDNSSGFQGLYRSTDAGSTFTTRSTTPNILDWSCDGSGTGGQGWYDLAVAADPTNAETIYVGGVDVWKSTNGGTTWAINSHWYGGCSVPAVHADCHFLGYSPVNGKLYAGDDGGIWSTSNGGTTWLDHTPGMTIGQIYKLGQAQTEREKVINGFQDNGTYTYTSTGWLATGGGDGMECAIDYTDGAYTYHTVYYGDIYRKVNNANEFHIAGNGVFGITESGGWVTPFCLHETDPQTMFVGYKNIWRCRNIKAYNLVWEKISDNLAGSNSVDMSVVENSPANPNILYAARGDSKLFRTDNCLDSPPTWTDMSGYLPSANTPTDIEASPVNQDVVYITMPDGIFKSVDRGHNWTNIRGNLPTNLHFNTIAYYKNANEGLYVGTDAGIYYKDASLTNWIEFDDGMPTSARVTELEIYYDVTNPVNDAIRASTYGRGLWGSDMYHSTPDADFIADHTTVPIGCGVNFTDLSNGVPTSWQWTFTGATPPSSTVKNPANIVYPTAGTYTVKMICSNSNGTDSITKTNYITVSSTLTPQVDFTADKTVLCTGEFAKFTDLSQNCPSSWTWEFTPGTVTYLQGTTNHDPDPIVQFDQPGAYTVKLTVYNGVGSNFLVKTDYIMNGGFTLPFEETFENGFSQRAWTIVNPDASKTWDTITVAGTTPGSKAAWINFYNYPYVNRRDQLISPAIDLSDYVSVTLNFKHAYAQRASIKDSLIVRVSDDCGTNWTRVFGAGPNGTPSAFVTHAPMLSAFYPASAADWCGGGYGVNCYSIDLTPWAGMNDVKIMFESFNRNGNNLFLDNVEISGIVGIAETVKSSGIRVFPNPSHDVFTVIIPVLKKATPVSVFTLQGKEVIKTYIPAGTEQFRLDLSGLPKGIYYLKVITDEKTQVNKLVLD